MESECSIYSVFALLSRPICSNTNHHFWNRQSIKTKKKFIFFTHSLK
jgi:hypothetical protein